MKPRDPYALLKWVLAELVKRDVKATEAWKNNPRRDAEVRAFGGNPAQRKAVKR